MPCGTVRRGSILAASSRPSSPGRRGRSSGPAAGGSLTSPMRSSNATLKRVTAAADSGSVRGSPPMGTGRWNLLPVWSSSPPATPGRQSTGGSMWAASTRDSSPVRTRSRRRPSSTTGCAPGASMCGGARRPGTSRSVGVGTGGRARSSPEFRRESHSFGPAGRCRVGRVPGTRRPGTGESAARIRAWRPATGPAGRRTRRSWPSSAPSGIGRSRAVCGRGAGHRPPAVKRGCSGRDLHERVEVELGEVVGVQSCRRLAGDLRPLQRLVGRDDALDLVPRGRPSAAGRCAARPPRRARRSRAGVGRRSAR